MWGRIADLKEADMSDLGTVYDDDDPTPEAPPAAPSQDEKWKQENAKLRDENRRLNAEALASRHGLNEAEARLLTRVPKDEQEAEAKALADARQAAPPTPVAREEEPVPEPDPALADMGDVPNNDGEPFVNPTSDEEIGKRISGASSAAEVDRILDDIKDAHRQRVTGEA
jgi:hypothetical protein